MRNILFFLVILSSMGFYYPKGITENDISWKIVFYIVCFLFIILGAKRKQHLYDKSYDKAYLIMLSFMLISILIAYIIHDQSLFVGFFATLPFATYGLYFFLRKNNITVNIIEKFIMVFGLLSIVIMIISLLTFPNSLFGWTEFDADRGGIRPRVVGFSWIALFFFHSIERYYITKKKLQLVFIIICYIALLASLSRQVILVSTIIGLILNFSYQKFKNKILVLASVLVVFLTILPNISYVQKMIEYTKTQQDLNKYNEDDIRIQGWNFFILKGQESMVTHVFGNGAFSVRNSKYGKEMAKTGFYPADESIAGFYYLFGAIATLCLLYIFKKGIFEKSSPNRKYLNYYLLYVFILSFASGPLVYPNEILTVVLVIYVKSSKAKVAKNYNYKRNNGCISNTN